MPLRAVLTTTNASAAVTRTCTPIACRRRCTEADPAPACSRHVTAAAAETTDSVQSYQQVYIGLRAVQLISHGSHSFARRP